MVQDPIARLERRIDRLDHFAFGNGEKGADERLRNIEASQEKLSQAMTRVEGGLKTLVDERARTQHEWSGARKLLAIAATVFTVAFGSTAAWLASSLNHIAKLLPGG